MKSSLAFLFALAMFLSNCSNQTSRYQGPIYTGPIVDAHGHFGDSFPIDAMVDILKKNQVSKQVLMARYYHAGDNDWPGTDEKALKLSEKYPGIFYPLVGMQRPELTAPDKWMSLDEVFEALIQETIQKLASSKYYGIGEFIVRHWAYSKGIHAEQNNPIYSTFMKRMSLVAAQFDVPIVVHMEGYPEYVSGFEKLIYQNPTVRFVWSHNCGRSKAPVVQSLLSKHDNLFCDLGGMTNVGVINYGTGRPRMEEFTSLIEEDGILFPDMLRLYEQYSDRFMIGMDVAHAPGMNDANYSRRIERFRELLGQLQPATARKLAETNALRVFKLQRPLGLP